MNYLLEKIDKKTENKMLLQLLLFAILIGLIAQENEVIVLFIKSLKSIPLLELFIRQYLYSFYTFILAVIFSFSVNISFGKYKKIKTKVEELEFANNTYKELLAMPKTEENHKALLSEINDEKEKVIKNLNHKELGSFFINLVLSSNLFLIIIIHYMSNNIISLFTKFFIIFLVIALFMIITSRFVKPTIKRINSLYRE